MTSFYRPALFAAVPRVCPDGLRAANGLMRGTAETLGAVGPLAAGALVATIGVGAAFWVTAGCYTVAAVMLVGLGVRPVTSAPEQRRRTSVTVELRTGLRTVWEDAYLRRALALVTVAGLALTGPVTVGVPWLAHQQRAATAVAFGLMLSMWSAGSVVGALAAGALRRTPGWRGLTTVVVAVLAAGLVTLGFAGEVAVAAVALLGMGAVAGFFNVVLITEIQQRAEDGSLGRVMSVVELAEIVSTPASYLLAGLLLDASSTMLFVTAAGRDRAASCAVVAAGRLLRCVWWPRPGRPLHAYVCAEQRRLRRVCRWVPSGGIWWRVRRRNGALPGSTARVPTGGSTRTQQASLSAYYGPARNCYA